MLKIIRSSVLAFLPNPCHFPTHQEAENHIKQPQAKEPSPHSTVLSFQDLVYPVSYSTAGSHTSGDATTGDWVISFDPSPPAKEALAKEDQ